MPARPQGDARTTPSWLALHRRAVAVAATLAVAAVVVTVWMTRGAAPTQPAAVTDSPRAAAVARPEVVPAAANRALPPVADPHVVATVAFHEGDYQAAYERYRDAVARNDKDAESWSNCGQALVRLGRVAEAVPMFERAIALNPQRWAYHFNLAHASGLLGQWDRAVQEYALALDQFPDDPVTEFNLGMALHKRGDEATAAEHYRRAIALKADDATFYLALGISSERLGRTADAIAAYRRYVEMVPAAPDAANVQARIDRLAATPAAAVPAQPPKQGIP